MASVLSVTKIDVVSRRGSNGIPSSGWVQFSDDKYYHWSRDPESNIFFSGYRKRHNTGEHFTFNSAKRAKLIEDYLNTHNVETTVYKVRMGA